MNTMHNQTAGTPTGRQTFTTKAVLALLALAMLAILAASIQPAVNPFEEEIPQVVHHICNSCGEEIPQRAHTSNEKIAGGASGGVLSDRKGKNTAGGAV